MKKKIVGLLLAAMCFVALLPATAFAVNYEYTLSVTDPSSTVTTLENGRSAVFTFAVEGVNPTGTLKWSSSDSEAVNAFVAFGTIDRAYIYPHKVTEQPVVLTFWIERSGVRVSNEVSIDVSVTASTYSINCLVAEGEGTVSVDKSQATAGETITITTTPAEGYSLKTLTVSSDGDEPIEVSESGTFIMPDANVAVTAEFEEIPAEPSDPTDPAEPSDPTDSTEPTPVIPVTGDFNGLLFFALAGIVLLGVCAVAIARKKANR